jgi:probable DNA repair protein
MGAISAAEIDAHLCAGGTVVTASDRAARAILAAFHRARRAQGREAWTEPRVLDWQTFARRAWDEFERDGRLPLNSVQERSLWERILADSGHFAALLEGPRRNLAAMAKHAHALLCSYAPEYLDARARRAWQQDAAAFSEWLSAFDVLCQENDVISPSRLALELIPLLTSAGARPPLLLAGFDRLLPAQQRLFDAWGEWKHVESDDPAASIAWYAALDASTELAACASWCRQRLLENPNRRILVIAQDISRRRGEIERAFLRHAASDPAFRFEFSLGVPLAQAPPARSARMLLRWLDGALAEHELDWLFSTSYAAISEQEKAALQASMRALRNRGCQRTEWTLRAFLEQRISDSPIPQSWAKRVSAAENRLKSVAARESSPLEWAELAPHLLEDLGWPGSRPPSSAEFQAMRRWQQAIETCGSLGFDGRRMKWQTFLGELLRIVDETLFAPESEDAPIVIAGAAESAGLTADAISFLGANEDAWPARGDRHPFLPMDVQREFRMPHASPQLDWDLARAITVRLLASAPEVHFSFAQQSEGVEARPSRLIAQFAGAPQPLPANLVPSPSPPAVTLTFEDATRIPYRSLQADLGAEAATPHLRGGAKVLTAQSQCPFQAFAIARLGASEWDPAETGLTAADRGQLLHKVLEAVWSGPPGGVRSLQELKDIADLRGSVAGHVSSTMANKVPERVRSQMPPRYLEIEEVRLTRLVTEWLEFEKSRVAFQVERTELDETRTIAGVSLNLRLDRLDRLSDGTLLVVDYKTGDVSTKSWDLPRPEDVQLPLYAGFGLGQEEILGGLVFAKVRTGEMCFAGSVANAASTLDTSLKGNNSLVRNPMSAEQLMDWRDAVEQLARDFLAGRADVDPRDAPRTCERCGLHTLCRIQERELICGEDADAEVAHD